MKIDFIRASHIGLFQLITVMMIPVDRQIMLEINANKIDA